MIAQIVSAALWAVLASLVLSLALGTAVASIIRLSRPAAATRQALWSIALGAAGLAPVVILAVMLIRGAAITETPPASIPAAKTAAVRNTGHAERSRGTSQPGHAERSRGTTTGTETATVQPAQARAALRLPALPDVAPLAAQAIAIIWALGALAGLIGLGRSLVRVRSLKLRSSALDGDLVDELPWLTTMPGREIYLRLSYETETPIAVGFRRPVILIPTEMATAAGLTSIEPLVMHEFAHLSRYDDWTNLAQRAIERVFWFNPLVWLLGRRLALEREVAADEAVVARTHDAKNYATALWRMAQEMRMPEHVVVAPGAMLTRKQISVRIERLLEDAPVTGRRFGATAFAAAVLALTGVAGVAATAPPIVLANDAPVTPASPIATRTAMTPATHVVAKPKHIAPVVAQAHAISTGAAHRNVSKAPAPHNAPVAPMPPEKPSNPAVDPDSIANEVLSDSEIQKLKNLGPRISADVMRQLAEQHRQAAEQNRQVAEQNRQVTEHHRQIAESGRQHAEALPAVLTRELVAACIACDFSGRDLKGIDLSALNLTGDDFSHADLAGAHFDRTTLRGTSFSHASLSGAQFTDAKLTGIDFNHANLSGANFTNAFLTGVDLSHALMDGAVTTGIHLIGSTLP